MIQSGSKRCWGAVAAALLLGATLAGCAGGTMAGLTSTPDEVAAPASTPSAPSTAPPSAPAAPAPRGTAAAPAPSPAQSAGLTREEINTECWMRAESQRLPTIDARLKWVDRCVAERTKAR